MRKFLTGLTLFLLSAICVCGLFACGGVEFKINFIVDGEVYATVKTGGAETIRLPDNPEKDDYTFDGWFWDKDTWHKPFTANSLLDAPLSSDMNVYAKWTFVGEITPPEPEPTPEITEYFEKKQDGSYYGKVYNTTTQFDFTGRIDYDGEYFVCTDAACTKPLNDNKTTLNAGDNIFYILFDNGNKTTATVRRRTICTVTFDTANGTAVAPQTVEEDKRTPAPKNPMRIGYTFSAWDYDFNEPITANTTVTAIWNANTNTPYKIEYYLQNLEDDNYTLQENDTENLTGTTDTQATTTKTYEHFTVMENTASDNINADGSTVLKVYYTRDSYNFTAQSDNAKGGSISCTGNGTYKYGKEITLSATVTVGYDFVGWYNNNAKISDNLQYSFNIYENNNIVAKYFAHNDTPYKVEYYLENLENDNYTLQENDTKNLTGTTDTTVTAEIKTYEHFTIKNNTVSGNINGDGSTVFKVYYDLERFTVNINSESPNISLSETYKGQFKYGKIIPNINVDFNRYLGYENRYFINNIEYVVNSIISGFIVTKDTIYNINCNIKEEMANFIFSSTDKLCSITDIKNKNTAEIIIPDYVTSISYEFNDCAKLKNISVDTNNYYYKTIDGNLYSKDGKTLIKYPFAKTQTSFCIPEGVINIKERAFYNCSYLADITIPYSVTNMGDEGFYGCSSLISVNYLGTIDGWAQISFNQISSANPLSYAKNLYINNELITEAIITTASKINTFAFHNCESLISISIGNGVTSIGNFAFSGCSSLTSITIPDSVTSIGSSAFSGCSSLESITTPLATGGYPFGYIFGGGSYKGGTATDQIYYSKISNKIITYCIPLSLKTVTITNGNILRGAFYNCSYLTNIIIGNNVASIEDRAFYNCSSLTNITIGNSITNIGEDAFYGCSSLTSITIPDSITSIGNYAFLNCTALTSINYTSTIDEWVQINFGNDKSNPLYYARDLYINNELVTEALINTAIINNYALCGCSLRSITIGYGVTNIGSYAFSRCSSLTNITFRDTTTWYRASGCLTDVTNPSINASFFKDTYKDHSWYKE